MNLDGPTLRLARDARAGAEALAHRPAFAIGPLRVHPSACRIRWGDGPERSLQPLAMRVLTALAEARGETCSRDDLLATCWNSRIVGDDAIHRVISHLRRDLLAVAGDALRIDTIARVGYRLRIVEGAAALDEHVRETGTAQSVPSRAKRRWLWPGLGAAAAVAVAAAAWPYPSPVGTTIAVEPVVGAEAGTRRLADDLTAELARLASPMVGLTFVETGQAVREPDLILRVSLGRSAAGPNSHVRLVDGETGAVVWSRDFEAQGQSPDALRERMAYAVAGLIHCGLDRSTEAYGEPVSRRLYLSACDALNEGDWPRAHAYSEQIVALRPDIAASWACLATTTIAGDPTVRGSKDAAAKRAMAYARKALAVDSHSGMAHLALARALDSQGRSNFSALEKGMKLDPDHGPLQAFYSAALKRAGYMDAAVEPIQRAAALQPNSKLLYDALFYTTLLDGRRAEAVAMNRRMQRLWRDDPLVVSQRSALVSQAPDPAAALRELGEGSPAVHGLSGTALELLRWSAAPGGYEWARFDRLAEREAASDSDAAWTMAYMATRMGDQRRALVWLKRAPVDRSGAWEVLFSPQAAELRRDRQFFAKMAEIGLVAFWQARGQWPDFCSEDGLRYDCRQEARRLATQAPGNGRYSGRYPV
jgi:DNA-binding winged helix-turn-helix (wHTH) protein/tetratricopeptide (TPR) repeat protein